MNRNHTPIRKSLAALALLGALSANAQAQATYASADEAAPRTGPEDGSSGGGSPGQPGPEAAHAQ